MRGQSSKIYSPVTLQPRYRGTLNSYCAISEAGLSLNNFGNDQAEGNTSIDALITPMGILAGSVVAISGAAEVGPALNSNDKLDGAEQPVVGIAERDAAGEAFESTSSAASGSITYLHGSNVLVEIPVYETVKVDGETAITYAAGDKLYASSNGLLTNASGLDTEAAELLTAHTLTVVGILVEPPVTSQPGMVVQMRI